MVIEIKNRIFSFYEGAERYRNIETLLKTYKKKAHLVEKLQKLVPNRNSTKV